MATAGDVITRAFRLIGTVRIGQSANAGQLASGVPALNEMLDDWATNDGIDLGLYDVDTDTVISDRSLVRPLRFNLALELADEYGKVVTPHVQREADRTKSLLSFGEIDSEQQIDFGLLQQFGTQWRFRG